MQPTNISPLLLNIAQISATLQHVELSASQPTSVPNTLVPPAHHSLIETQLQECPLEVACESITAHSRLDHLRQGHLELCREWTERLVKITERLVGRTRVMGTSWFEKNPLYGVVQRTIECLREVTRAG